MAPSEVRRLEEPAEEDDRLKTLPDYEGLRENFRFLDLVDKLESRS